MAIETGEGSPPQVRGKLSLGINDEIQHGITPAGAGKTHAPAERHRSREDHPRRCGENPMQHVPHCMIRGSPPQVRGKLLLSTITTLQPRITPAGAGKTRHCGTAKQNGTDHPRRCGENLIPAFVKLSLIGSPPQVRGKPRLSYKTFSPTLDHPRRCGENCNPIPSETSVHGSPPQVRGKLLW